MISLDFFREFDSLKPKEKEKIIKQLNKWLPIFGNIEKKLNKRRSK